MDNLPNDPSKQNSPPPPFGSDFNPHSNPIPSSSDLPSASENPNNLNNSSPSLSSEDFEKEQHRRLLLHQQSLHQQRDAHGRFVPGHSAAEPPTPDKENIIKRAIIWVSKIKWTKVSLYFISFGAFLALLISHPAFKNLVNQFFPASSPVFAREISIQGILKSSETGLYTLVLPNQEAYSLKLKPAASLTNLKKLNEVVVKGRLGWAPFVIEEAEIYPLNFTTSSENPNPALQPLPSLTSQITPALSASPNLPTLYPNLTWETTQKKLLIFTSGKRKIEEEGIYLESSQISSFPQDFINYYLENLKATGFKETLNSISPEGITITYAKDDLFLTFGVKNIYQGSGNTKLLIGYKAFLEHN